MPLKITGGFFGFFSYVLYSTLLHLPPLRFHCVGGCWNQTQDCCDFGIDSQKLYNLSDRSHPLMIVPVLSIVLSGVYGFCISANYSLTSPILVELVSLEKFSTAYGFLLAAQVS